MTSYFCNACRTFSIAADGDCMECGSDENVIAMCEHETPLTETCPHCILADRGKALGLSAAASPRAIKTAAAAALAKP